MRRILFLALILAATQTFAGTGRIIIVNNDLPGQGFNDPTPVTPVGGNPGTTLGQQRLNVFKAAATRWDSMLDTDVDIIASARFTPIGNCTEQEGILGQAGPASWKANFSGAPRQNVWYPVALANKLAGRDLQPLPDFNAPAHDITVQFNSSLDNETCLASRKWYYGLDRDHGDDVDLFVVVLHELGHGLGISAAAQSPSFRDNLPSVSDLHTIDLSLGLRWDQMNETQRALSYLNTGNVAWDGDHTRTMAPQYLEPMTTLTITAPAPIARNYDIGFASFGPSANRTAMSGKIVQATDAMNVDGPSSTDACTTITNSAAIAGNIALVDRGSCTFVQKARNAQAAGAVGIVIVDNQRTSCLPPGMGGTAEDVTIPVISLPAPAGDAIKSQFNANVQVDAMLRVDPSQLAGGSPQGYVRLHAPCTAEPGSSKHHWDTAATPNLLMEPSINPDLLHGVDLTIYQLLDMGWTLPPRTGRRMGVR